MSSELNDRLHCFWKSEFPAVVPFAGASSRLFLEPSPCRVGLRSAVLGPKDPPRKCLIDQRRVRAAKQAPKGIERRSINVPKEIDVSRMSTVDRTTLVRPLNRWFPRPLLEQLLDHKQISHDKPDVLGPPGPWEAADR